MCKDLQAMDSADLEATTLGQSSLYYGLGVMDKGSNQVCSVEDDAPCLAR